MTENQHMNIFGLKNLNLHLTYIDRVEYFLIVFIFFTDFLEYKNHNIGNSYINIIIYVCIILQLFIFIVFGITSCILFYICVFTSSSDILSHSHYRGRTLFTLTQNHQIVEKSWFFHHRSKNIVSLRS